MTWRWAPPTRYMLRRNTASIMKGLVWILMQKLDVYHPKKMNAGNYKYVCVEKYKSEVAT